MISGLFLRNEHEGWGVSDDELVDALLLAEAIELLALMGHAKAMKAVQKQLVVMQELATKREYIMDTA